MALTAVTRRSVSDDVYSQIAAHVVRGEFPAGTNLPSERRLAEELGVSRPAVREALQRLVQGGLVTVRQGGATVVNNYRAQGGLGLLAHLLVLDDGLDLQVARSVLEARLEIGPIVARFAAERSAETIDCALETAYTALVDAHDAVERQRAALAYWDVIVDGADSIAFRLMYNELRDAYEPVLEELAGLMDAEVSRFDAYVALTAAITSGNPTKAKRAAENLLRTATETLLSIIANLEKLS